MSTLEQMAIRPITRALQVTFLLSAACLGQTTPTQNPPAPFCPATSQAQDQAGKPCQPPAPAAKKPSAAEQFPFPGQTKPAAPAPDSPTPATTPSDAAAQHPFPTQPTPKLPGDDSSSSSSSGSPDSDADPDMPKPGTEGSSTHRKLPKVKRVQTDDERVDEDLYVAKFYMRDDNLPGAYLRAKDAVSIQPDYSAAHFALGEIAQKMKKKDEAIAEFQIYLKLDPEGEKAKAAQKALADLQ
jgi:tetratricopeptide (TPR) repeat protein